MVLYVSQHAVPPLLRAAALPGTAIDELHSGMARALPNARPSMPNIRLTWIAYWRSVGAFSLRIDLRKDRCTTAAVAEFTEFKKT